MIYFSNLPPKESKSAEVVNANNNSPNTPRPDTSDSNRDGNGDKDRDGNGDKDGGDDDNDNDSQSGVRRSFTYQVGATVDEMRRRAQILRVNRNSLPVERPKSPSMKKDEGYLQL